MRRPLPGRRPCETFELKHGSHPPFKVSVGYDKGEPMEVFVTGAKVGSETEAIARDGAILLSLAIQYGVPLEVIRRAITREQDETPSTVIGAVIDILRAEP